MLILGIFSVIPILRALRIPLRWAYTWAFGLAPTIAYLTGKLLPISISGILQAPFGLIADTILWAMIGFYLGSNMREIPWKVEKTSYLLVSVWGIILMFNPRLSAWILTVANLLMLIIVVTIAMVKDFTRRTEEARYISVDKWGLILTPIAVIVVVLATNPSILINPLDPTYNHYLESPLGVDLAFVLLALMCLKEEGGKMLKGSIWRSAKGGNNL